MCKFVAKARQRNGEPYSPKTLLQLSSNLQSWAFLKNPNAHHFMNVRDPVFRPFHNVMDNMSKKLLSTDVGAVKKQAKLVSFDEEETLWAKGVIGDSTPDSLLSAVFFYSVYFCLRGGVEHRQLKLSQIEIKEVINPIEGLSMIKCIVYTEHGSKNRKGVVHQVHLDNTIVTHYICWFISW